MLMDKILFLAHNPYLLSPRPRPPLSSALTSALSIRPLSPPHLSPPPAHFLSSPLSLSVIIAVPMLMDIMLDAYYVFRFRSGRKLHWWARFWLLSRYALSYILSF